MASPCRALVTGGGGFLGSRIVEMLLDAGWSVKTFSRLPLPQFVSRGVGCEVGDITDAAAVGAAVRSTDVVFHVAAKVGIWGPYASYHSVNVQGTQHVIDACRANGVKKLVFTSTPSVVFDGGHMRHVSEDMPIPTRHLSPYCSTKAEAERRVIASNDSTLATVCLRPHIIWGPGDRHIVPRLEQLHRAGRLRLIGGGQNLVDTTFIDDAARAHLNAARALEVGNSVSGRAFFIAQGDPRPIGPLLDMFLAAAGLPPVTRTVPVPVAYGAAWAIEMAYRALGLEADPPLTRYTVLEMARDHYFDISAARQELGYEPSVSIEEGLDRLRTSLAAERREGHGAVR